MAAAEPNPPVSRIESEVKRIRALVERRQFPEALAVLADVMCNQGKFALAPLATSTDQPHPGMPTVSLTLPVPPAATRLALLVLKL